MSWIINVSRREFCKAGALLGGGLVLGFYLPEGLSAAQQAAEADGPFIPNAFIRIGRDDTVTIIVNHSEMGQGVYTSLPMLVAEELEADWQKIRIEPAPVDPAYNHTQWGMQGTGGSTSIRSSWEQLSKAGAVARIMLEKAAAATWNEDVKNCRAENGFVVHRDGKRRLSFGELAEKAAQMEAPQEVVLKQRKDNKVLGTPKKRLDTPDKTNGKALYGIDIMVPGMLTAVVARPPVFGGTVKGFDDTWARKIPGVKAVVQIDRGVAVVADHFPAAERGRRALKIFWDEGALAGLDSDVQLQQYRQMAEKPGAVAAQRGDFGAAMGRAAQKIEAAYHFPYLAHAPMEPLNCVADVRPDSCEIWVGTQMQTLDRNKAAEITGLPPEKVTLHTTYLGCGFGRRAVPDSHFVSEAVQISKAMQAPVKVIWTREDDIHGGYYRPASFTTLVAGLGEDGMPVALRQRIVCQSIVKGTPFEGGLMKDGIDATSVEGAADSPYEIADFLVEYHMAPAGVPVLWWRSVGHSSTAFAKECFIDELAHAAKQDPYTYRRKLLANHPRQLAVLDLAARKGSWGKPTVAGAFQGIAVHESFGSHVAQVAEVSVNKKNAIRVHKVVCVVDCGRLVNPDIIEAQMESAIVFGLSAALHDQITFTRGRVEQSNFDNYEILRLKEMPQVKVYIIKNDEPPGGIGEPGVPPIAPAVANAFFAATGIRLRALPMTPAAIKEAVKMI
ncbi:MAG: xanthine dehydrogenase family protein molybdopterin-binding subunit [Desulfobulbaceae bacterium]|nr:xanthine dehydrogenase family protein molybdopterin-binding subunit [Desulfobulbaceae bacterium]